MNDHPAIRVRVIVPVLLTLVLVNLLLMARLLWPAIGNPGQPSSVAASSYKIPSPIDPVGIPALQTPLPAVFPSLQPNAPVEEGLRKQGVMLFSMRDGAYDHLFVYHPQFLPLTRVTNSPWDDITPSVSPDGSQIAFSSRKDGFWNLYKLDLPSGIIAPLTNTPQYDGAPTWSPDGEWLAYESYTNDNLDIFLLSVTDPKQPPIPVTTETSADHAPAWSPQGRQLAFVSNRSGEDEIWLVKLDQTENRFTNVSHRDHGKKAHPAWSPDGRYLAWAAETDGITRLSVWDSQNPEQLVRHVGIGVEPIWDPNGNALLSSVISPNDTGLIVYKLDNQLTALPLTPLPGDSKGITWNNGAFVDQIAPYIAKGSSAASAPLFHPILTVLPISPTGRYSIVKLKDIQAPFPMLQDAVDESFYSLRQTVADKTGWDLLGNLESAFIPLTQASAPGMEENWLYTGRAVSINPVLFHAGWIVVVREDINGQTFWRVFLKARYQDGSQGFPMTRQPWDLDARYNGDPKVYEQGGQLGPTPGGYWIDFTELARCYGWQRLPALVSWITYYPAARFNQFVMAEDLDWSSAMAEVYPPEALSPVEESPTSTKVIPAPLPTLTSASKPTATRTPKPASLPTSTKQPPVSTP